MYFNAKDFDYNIENLLDDYYKYIKESKSYKMENRGEFVYADRISRNSQSSIQALENDESSLNTAPGNNPPASRVNYISEDEIELMRALYGEINRTLLPFILEILDTYEYSGSPMYKEQGITREFLGQVIDQVLRRAIEENDNPGEVFAENIELNVFTPWSRWMLMRAAAESIILNEIFGVRRPYQRSLR